MAANLAKWPSNRGLISKIRPSDGCKGNTVPSTVVRGDDLRKPGGHLGNVGSKVHKMLKPGGIFVTSTACLGDTMKFFKVIAPIGKFLGLMPLVKVFTVRELVDSLTDAGFEIDYQ